MEIAEYLNAKDSIHDLNDANAHEKVIVLEEVMISVP